MRHFFLPNRMIENTNWDFRNAQYKNNTVGYVLKHEKNQIITFLLKTFTKNPTKYKWWILEYIFYFIFFIFSLSFIVVWLSFGYYLYDFNHWNIVWFTIRLMLEDILFK